MTTNNAHKKAARQHQAETGKPYSQALRDVDTAAYRPNLVAHLGLDTPRGLGDDDERTAVTLNLAEPSRGGSGPHCFITGRTGSGKTVLVERIARSLVQDERTAPEVFVHSRLAKGRLPSTVTMLDPTSMVEDLVRLAEDRARENDARNPAVVLIDDCDGWVTQPRTDKFMSSGGTLRSLVKEGRSLGIHLVLTMQHEHVAVALGIAGSAAADNISIGIRLNSPTFSDLRMGEGWLQRSDGGDVHRLRVSGQDVRFRFEPV